MEYVIILEQGETSWGAYVPDLPGCIAVGETAEEAERLILEVIPDHIELVRESGEALPEPKTRALSYRTAA